MLKWMKASPRTASLRVLAIAAITVPISLSLAVMSDRVSDLLPAIWLAITLGAGGLLGALRCRTCGKPIHLNRVTIIGYEFRLWTVSAPRVCQACGHDVSVGQPTSSCS